MADSKDEQKLDSMVSKIKNMKTEVPKWDVALAGLLHEEAGKLGRGLRIADFQRLAKDHTIRFDDIMATMFEMVIAGAWHYEDPQGVKREISRDEVNKLYVGGRLDEADVGQYTGMWIPA